jgi:BirA family biotin operon repressor/biotin-[acetyl-CoA-carboxylase] ligase
VRERAFCDPLLILAETQTGGRGRGNNRWWSSAGSLTFSLVWRPPAHFARDEWPKVALTVGIAVCRTAQAFASEHSFGLRWPNDVYAGEQKLAGILVEAPAHTANGTEALVIGIGLNVNNAFDTAPADVQARAVSLTELAGRPLNRTDILLRLLTELLRVLAEVTSEPAALVEHWKTLCLLTGRRVTIAQGTTEVVGQCRGIDSAGALLLDTDRGRMRFFGGVLTRVE